MCLPNSARTTVIVCRHGRETCETYTVTVVSYDTICKNKINFSLQFSFAVYPSKKLYNVIETKRRTFKKNYQHTHD